MRHEQTYHQSNTGPVPQDDASSLPIQPPKKPFRHLIKWLGHDAIRSIIGNVYDTNIDSLMSGWPELCIRADVAAGALSIGVIMGWRCSWWVFSRSEVPLFQTESQEDSVVWVQINLSSGQKNGHVFCIGEVRGMMRMRD